MTFDAVFLSPHLDDAVLSCGGTIHRLAAAGRRVAILTVFTADLREDPPNRVLQEVYGRMRLGPAYAMSVRREEDQKACRRVGAEAVHWDVDEALARHADLPDLLALFEPPPASDAAVVEALIQRLRKLEGVPWVAAPLGLGGHMDHRIVRDVAEAVFGRSLRFYEDFPYALSLENVMVSPEVEGLQPRLEEVSRADVDARVDAIEAYESQISSLFGSRWQRLLPGKSLRAIVRRHVGATGGERFWSAE